MATPIKPTLTAGYGSIVPHIDYTELRQSMSTRPSLIKRLLLQLSQGPANSVKPTNPTGIKV